LGLSEDAAQRIACLAHARAGGRHSETTIARTRPGKAFTTAVIAAIAATAIKTTTGVVTAAEVAASAGGSSASTAILSSLTAKAVALAAGIAIVAGGVVAYKQLTSPELLPAAGSQPSVDDSPDLHLQEANQGSGIESEQLATPDSTKSSGRQPGFRTPHSQVRTSRPICGAGQAESRRDSRTSTALRVHAQRRPQRAHHR
jgi:hypothetical protein